MNRTILALGLAAVLAAPLVARADPLSVFQPPRVRAIAVTPLDIDALRALPPLSTFGTLRGTVSPAVDRVGSRADAAREAGFALRLPSGVPAALASRVEYAVTGPARTTFTFEAAKARAWARSRGVAPAPLPPGLDGARYTVTLRPVVLVTYGSRPRRAVGPHRRSSAERGARLGDFFSVMQGPVPTVAARGASLETLVRWFAAQPGVPPRLAAEVRAIGDPTQTLPIPVRFDKQTASRVRVDGVEGLVIGDETGIGSAVVWTKGGRIYAAGGTLPQSRVLALADTLR